MSVTEDGIWVEDNSQAEIGDAGSKVTADEDVLRLEVSMGNRRFGSLGRGSIHLLMEVGQT